MAERPQPFAITTPPGALERLHERLAGAVLPDQIEGITWEHVNSERDDVPVFDVVVPSLPGYGYSTSPTQTGFGIAAMAETLHLLMLKLGYTSYTVQGGDWGSTISRVIAIKYPQYCKAMHINGVYCLPPVGWNLWKIKSALWFAGLTSIYDKQSDTLIRDIYDFIKKETGYLYFY
ncbi:uncharacterized protein VTP21DRAFT_8162 [Calcarisporiella thermophila]|uniref:uncharacterized protein n=1 Tax=Calcarisporiella thermophila TaxID=911321 RepID=UPI003743C0E9